MKVKPQEITRYQLEVTRRAVYEALGDLEGVTVSPYDLCDKLNMDYVYVEIVEELMKDYYEKVDY